MSWSSSFIFKGISQRRFIFKKRSKFDYEVWLNVQSLIKKIYPLGMFWLYNFRVFDALKFVTFRKSWDHILELYAKAKSSWISQQIQFFNKKSKKKLTTLWSPCMGGVVSPSSRSFWYSFDWPRKDQSLSQLGNPAPKPLGHCLWSNGSWCYIKFLEEKLLFLQSSFNTQALTWSIFTSFNHS